MEIQLTHSQLLLFISVVHKYVFKVSCSIVITEFTKAEQRISTKKLAC